VRDSATLSITTLSITTLSITTLSITTLSIVFCAIHVSAAESYGRPNVIFLFTDDHATHAISAYGSKINKTPHLDRIAREGMLFQNSFCTNSICGPSRAVILTGKHSHLNGFMTNYNQFNGSQQTFPKLLRKVGYQTAMIGKWHLGTEPTGFDFWEVLRGQGPYYNPKMRTPNGDKPYTGYTTEIITDIALDWLETKRDPAKPFMLMCQHKAPHREWAPGPKYLTMYDDVKIPEPATLFDDWSNRNRGCKTQTMTLARHFSSRDMKLVPPNNLTPEQLELWNAAYGPKNEAFRKANLKNSDLVRWKYQRYIKDYLRCIAAVDDNIGRMLAYLDETGLAKNTIVIYSSDQGFYLGDHGWYDKRWMYEESLKMPLLVRWPGVVKPGTINRDIVQNLDYAETFLDIAGAKIPGDMQGRSLLPILKGQTPSDWRQSMYYHYYENPGAHTVERHFGVRTQRHKLIRYYDIDEWELFDLEKDPDELESVWADPSYAKVRAELEVELRRLQVKYLDENPIRPKRGGRVSRRAQRVLRRLAAKVKTKQVFQLDAPDGKAHRNLDPSAKPLTVGAWCTSKTGNGVIIAQGGASLGYSLYLSSGELRFAIRNNDTLFEVKAPKTIAAGTRFHAAGVLSPKGKISLLVDGKVVAEGKGELIAARPADSLTTGDDTGSAVADYVQKTKFEGTLEDIRVFWGVVDAEAQAAWLQKKQ